jgi:hypothetical protein
MRGAGVRLGAYARRGIYCHLDCPRAVLARDGIVQLGVRGRRVKAIEEGGSARGVSGVNVKSDDHCKLRYGPYNTPWLEIGTEVMCELRGLVQIADYSEGRIPWPRARKRANTGKLCRKGRTLGPLILAWDLVRAVRLESSRAVAYWWGVSRLRVTQWRKCLGTPKWNPGSWSLVNDCLTTARTPANFAKAKRTRLAHRSELIPRPWLAEEEKLLGTAPDPHIAVRLGRSRGAITHRRRRLGIPGFGFQAVKAQGALCTIDAPGLRRLRKSRQLTLKELSAKSGIFVTYLLRREKGTLKWIKPDELERLSTALKCPAQQLVLGKYDESPQTPAARDESSRLAS